MVKKNSSSENKSRAQVLEYVAKEHWGKYTEFGKIFCAPILFLLLTIAFLCLIGVFDWIANGINTVAFAGEQIFSPQYIIVVLVSIIWLFKVCFGVWYKCIKKFENTTMYEYHFFNDIVEWKAFKPKGNLPPFYKVLKSIVITSFAFTILICGIFIGLSSDIPVLSIFKIFFIVTALSFALYMICVFLFYYVIPAVIYVCFLVVTSPIIAILTIVFYIGFIFDTPILTLNETERKDNRKLFYSLKSISAKITELNKVINKEKKKISETEFKLWWQKVLKFPKSKLAKTENKLKKLKENYDKLVKSVNELEEGTEKDKGRKQLLIERTNVRKKDTKADDIKIIAVMIFGGIRDISIPISMLIAAVLSFALQIYMVPFASVSYSILMYISLILLSLTAGIGTGMFLFLPVKQEENLFNNNSAIRTVQGFVPTRHFPDPKFFRVPDSCPRWLKKILLWPPHHFQYRTVTLISPKGQDDDIVLDCIENPEAFEEYFNSKHKKPEEIAFYTATKNTNSQEKTT